MGKPRFIPAEAFERHRDFGRNPSAMPDPGSQLEVGSLVWAFYQHLVACSVRWVAQRDGGSTKPVVWLAQRLGAETSWLTRKLNGQAPADLGEMVRWLVDLDLEAPSLADVTNLVLYAVPMSGYIFVEAAPGEW